MIQFTKSPKFFVYASANPSTTDMEDSSMSQMPITNDRVIQIAGAVIIFAIYLLGYLS